MHIDKYVSTYVQIFIYVHNSVYKNYSITKINVTITWLGN